MATKDRSKPMVMLLRLKADGKTVERCMPDSDIAKWRSWCVIPDYMTPEDYAAGLREMGVEVQWLAIK